MHALGICEGLVENGWHVTIIGGPGLASFSGDLPSSVRCIEIDVPKGPFKYLGWLTRLSKAVRNGTRQKSTSIFISRYAVKAFPLLLVLSAIQGKKEKTVLEVNSFAYHMFGKLPRPMSYILAGLEMQLANRFNIIYVVSESMAKDPRNKRARVPIVNIPNGVTSKEITFTNGRDVPKHQPPRLVYLGTLMPYWDFDYLAKAINYLHEKNNVKVCFYGQGPRLEFIRSSLNNMELVEFPGAFRRSEIGELVNPSSDILILPPKTKEDMVLTGGLSTKIFDYLSMNMPIVAPSDGEINTILFDEKNSVLYSSSDFKSFAHRVNYLLDHAEVRETIAKKAYEEFKRKYTWKARMAILTDSLL